MRTRARSTQRAALLFGLLAWIGACPKDSITTPPMATDEDVSQRMQGHFEAVSELKDAVIAGDLATVKELGEVLRDRETNADPLDWKPHVGRVVSASESAASATDLAAAARAAASLGAACGNCHRATSADPGFDPDPPPIDRPGTSTAMQRHQWGVDRMWEGLIGPSSESWRWGAETVDETPGCDQLDSADEYRVELCRRVEALGRSALDARDHRDRSRIYGEFLSTCTGCHSLDAPQD